MKPDSAAKKHGSQHQGHLLLVAQVDELMRIISRHSPQIEPNGKNIECVPIWFQRSPIAEYKHQLEITPSVFDSRPWEEEATARLCRAFLSRS